MVTTRPLLYLSLPGLALLIGFYFLRRQKRSSGGKKDRDRNNESLIESKVVTFQNGNLKDDSKHLDQTEKAISIDVKKSNMTDGSNSNNNEFDNNLGKSAPINITQGIRSFKTNYIHDDDINLDDNIMEFRNQLSLYDKDDSYISSLDLPDSPNRKICTARGNDMRNVEEPVVVKATVNPNISLSSSFIENKYIEESEIINQQQQQQQKQQPIEEEKQEQIHDDNKVNDGDDNNNNDKTTIIQDDDHHQSSQSANSPPTSEFSAHSGDSGKGSSLPQSERLKIINYDFILPTSLIGQLCGRRRAYLNQIKTKSGANIALKGHNYSPKIKICSLKGTEKEINTALSLIRSRFPIKRYPNLTLQKIEYAEPQSIVQLSLDYTSCLQLRLIEGINNDVIIVSVLSGNHLFVHHPSHPSYRSVNVLHQYMNVSYETGEAPLLPEIAENAICVAKIGSLWYRVQIVTNNEKEQNCLVKFLDYGGYIVVSTDCLRQIRSDFMSVPFQATECILSNVEPIGSEWTQEAIETLCHLTAGLVLQAQIVRYNESNIPEINLYAPLSKNSVIFINKEMLARGFAK